MTKTVWMVTDKTDNTKTELIYYHFRKEPKFPAWYMEKGHLYIIEIIWSVKLVKTFNTFFKCLTHYYKIH